jgi:hypothetical protein
MRAELRGSPDRHRSSFPLLMRACAPMGGTVRVGQR